MLKKRLLVDLLDIEDPKDIGGPLVGIPDRHVQLPAAIGRVGDTGGRLHAAGRPRQQLPRWQRAGTWHAGRYRDHYPAFEGSPANAACRSPANTARRRLTQRLGLTVKGTTAKTAGSRTRLGVRRVFVTFLQWRRCTPRLNSNAFPKNIGEAADDETRADVRRSVSAGARSVRAGPAGRDAGAQHGAAVQLRGRAGDARCR